MSETQFITKDALEALDAYQVNIMPSKDKQNQDRINQILEQGASFTDAVTIKKFQEENIQYFTTDKTSLSKKQIIQQREEIPVTPYIEPITENSAVNPSLAHAAPSISSPQERIIKQEVRLNLDNLSDILDAYLDKKQKQENSIKEEKEVKQTATYQAQLSINVLSCTFDYVNITETDIMLIFITSGNFPITLENSVIFEKLKFLDLNSSEQKELMNITCLGRPTRIPGTDYSVIFFLKDTNKQY